MKSISVVIISKNEEKNIRRCLESVKWADEIVLIDSQSDDMTREIASEYKAKIYSPPWRGYGPAKHEGVKRSSHDWIFSIDADEEVSADLKKEIRQILSDDVQEVSGYYVPRMTSFLGRWIRHSGWYPDYVLRLFNKQDGNFNLAVVHERVEISGETKKLKNDLLHYSYPDLDEYFRKFNIYTTIGAEELYKQNKTASIFKIVIKPVAAFIKHFVIKLGFLDGLEGFLISLLSSLAVMIKYAKLRDLIRKGNVDEQTS